MRPGARLRAGREAQSQSLEQAARHLRLDEPTLAAIESDQYPAHVPATFLRGYLRAYAKWLELPADEIVAAYNEQQPDEAKLSGLKNLLPLPESDRSRNGTWLWWLMGVVVLVVAVTAVVLLVPSDWFSRLRSSEAVTTVDTSGAPEILPIESSSGELALQLAPEEPLPVTESTDTVTGQPSTTPTEPAATGAVPSSSNVSTSNPSTGSKESSTGKETGTTTVPTVTAPTSATARPTGVEPLPGVGETLELAFIEDCWIRVTDAAGNVLSVGIKQKGQRIRLSGAAPLTVVLGNPPGVQLRHNGRPVDLSSYPSSRPATMTLQQQVND